MTVEYASKKHPGDHLLGLVKGDAVIYHRLGEELECDFIELYCRNGKWATAVNSHKWGLFLAPPSQVSLSPRIRRVL